MVKRTARKTLELASSSAPLTMAKVEPQLRVGGAVELLAQLAGPERQQPQLVFVHDATQLQPAWPGSPHRLAHAQHWPDPQVPKLSPPTPQVFGVVQELPVQT